MLNLACICIGMAGWLVFNVDSSESNGAGDCVKLIVAHLPKAAFISPVVFVPCLQESATGFYPEPDEFISQMVLTYFCLQYRRIPSRFNNSFIFCGITRLEVV